MEAVNDVIRPFEGNINPGYPTGIKVDIQPTKQIDKENDKLYISVSNTKEILDQFLSLANKYGWVCLALMLGTDTGVNKVFRGVEQIQFEEIQNKERGYFGLRGIRNVVAPPPIPLIVSDLTKLSYGNKTKVSEIQNFVDRVRSYMIAKEIEVSIYKSISQEIQDSS